MKNSLKLFFLTSKRVQGGYFLSDHFLVAKFELRSTFLTILDPCLLIFQNFMFFGSPCGVKIQKESTV
jgi:hypothetical protein